jgi:hypothetical protein
VALPTFLAGQKIRASQLQALVPLYAYKFTDQAYNTASTVLQPDVDLLLTGMVASAVYELEAMIYVFESANVTNMDVQLAFSFPAGAALSWGGHGLHVNWTAAAGAVEFEAASIVNDTSSPTSSISYGLANNAVPPNVQIRGILRMGATLGTLQLQAAQATSSGTMLTIMQDSYLKLTRIY